MHYDKKNPEHKGGKHEGPCKPCDCGCGGKCGHIERPETEKKEEHGHGKCSCCP